MQDASIQREIEREREREKQASKPSKAKRKEQAGELEKQGSQEESNSSSKNKKGGRTGTTIMQLTEYTMFSSMLAQNKPSEGSRVPHLGLRVPNPRKHPV